MTSQPDYKYSVAVKGKKELRKDFTRQDRAARYANQLLRQGHKAILYPYNPPMRAVDFAAQRLEKDGRL